MGVTIQQNTFGIMCSQYFFAIRAVTVSNVVTGIGHGGYISVQQKLRQHRYITWSPHIKELLDFLVNYAHPPPPKLGHQKYVKFQIIITSYSYCAGRGGGH